MSMLSKWIWSLFMCLFYVCLSCLTTGPHSAPPLHFEQFFSSHTLLISIFTWTMVQVFTCNLRRVAGCGKHQNNYHLTIDSVSSVDILAYFTRLKMYFTNNHFGSWSNFHYERRPHFGFDLHNFTGLICSHHAHQLHFQRSRQLSQVNRLR